MPVADWPTKRAWVDYAYEELGAAGYRVSSAYTLVKDPQRVNFSYRDNLWMGSDLLATGIASFGHISGMHYQNVPEWKQYSGRLLEENRLPLGRGMQPTPHQLLIREMILQLKRGYLDATTSATSSAPKFSNIWRDQWRNYAAERMLTHRGGPHRADSPGITACRRLAARLL